MQKTKMLYASPESDVLELRLEGVIASSPITNESNPNFSAPFTEEDDWSE